jgi:F0F1-type ATP synthase membrane subunit b/b'
MPTFNATFLFVLLSFAIFVALMKAIYFDPIMAIKNERERKLTQDEQSAKDFLKQFEKLHSEYQAGIKQARLEAHQLIQQIRQQAKTSAQQLVINARNDAQSETDRQMADLSIWRENTYGELESERAALTQTVIAKVKTGGKIGSATGS